MLDELVRLTLAEADGDRAYSDLVTRWNIDRYFTFPGMLKSCEYSAGKMREYGFDEAKVEKFPADGKTFFGYWKMPYAWDATEATLTIVSPEDREGEVLASYPSVPCTLTMWSPPTPKKGVEGVVVAMERGDRDADYAGISVKGKFILTNLRGGSVRNQAIKRGAVGVISDTCRHPLEMPDSVDWMNAWSDDPSGWGLTAGEKNIIGFNISHRRGKSLRALIAKGPVRLHARVDARVYEGVMPAATGLIKGRTDEEVITLGHGAEQGANDNSSGCACMLEALRTIRSLIDKGRLKKPKRSIRMLITWELYATLAFVSKHKRRFDRTVAGLCLDMVGESQHVISAPLGVHRNLESNVAFTDTFKTLLAEELWTRRWPGYRWADRGFGLTDSVISDPSIGVPTSYLGQGGGGDHNWHTSEDTPGKADPKTLKYVSAYTASFLYSLANAGEKEAAWLAEAVSCDYRRQIAAEGFKRLCAMRKAESAGQLSEAYGDACRRIAYMGALGSTSSGSVYRLSTKKRVESAVAEALTMIEDAVLVEGRHLEDAAEGIALENDWRLDTDLAEKPSTEMKQAAGMIVSRTKFGPLVFDAVPPVKRKGLDDGRWGGPLMSVLYWCDDRRTLAEAMELASAELDRPLTGIVSQIRKCGKLGLVKIRKAS